MGEETAIEIDDLRESYDALNRNDIAAMVGYFDPEIVWIIPTEYKGGGTARGRAEVQAHIERGRNSWAEGTCLPERIIVAGDKAVVLVHVHVLVKGDTEWIDGRHGAVFTYRNGKPIEHRVFDDWQEALAWAGIAAPDA